MPTIEAGSGAAHKTRKYPIQSILLAAILAPAVLACSRPISGDEGLSRTTETSRPPTPRARDTLQGTLGSEDQELLSFGERLIDSRRDCIIYDLGDELTSLIRGSRTYRERAVSSNDPNRSKIEAVRIVNGKILQEEAGKLSNESFEGQANGLSTVYLALARTNLEASRRAQGTLERELFDQAGCGVIKVLSLQVLLDGSQGNERGSDRFKS